jgi:hypothetical protein
MTSCPSDQELQRLLNDELDGADEAESVIHIESCVKCQERLNDLTSCDDFHPSWLGSPGSEIGAKKGDIGSSCLSLSLPGATP